MGYPTEFKPERYEGIRNELNALKDYLIDLEPGSLVLEFDTFDYAKRVQRMFYEYQVCADRSAPGALPRFTTALGKLGTRGGVLTINKGQLLRIIRVSPDATETELQQPDWPISENDKGE